MENIKLKMKSTEEILNILLFDRFEKDFLSGKVCAGDQIQWIKRDKDLIDRYYKEWLISNKFAEKID